MDTKLLVEVTSWLRGTDISEFVYKKDGQNIEIKTKEAEPAGSIFECNLTPVLSPAVGIYRTAVKGKTLLLKEGQSIEEGASLGIIEMPNKKFDVKAPVKGTLRVISVEDGKPVEYGQPLFFIEP
ncbi:biotin carboxyl carrier protein [Elusimicrobium posterum]|uniref:acetyl-CoA carboxylase biotin carboxyl carrier protein n=1 Tax=Elusimicrobium posterum TaxID=3116653 RepID=UPI003C7314A5